MHDSRPDESVMTTRIGTTHAALEVYNQIYAITPRLYASPRNKQIHEWLDYAQHGEYTRWMRVE